METFSLFLTVSLLFRAQLFLPICLVTGNRVVWGGGGGDHYSGEQLSKLTSFVDLGTKSLSWETNSGPSGNGDVSLK
jgi:hypothetical protein